MHRYSSHQIFRPDGCVLCRRRTDAAAAVTTAAAAGVPAGTITVQRLGEILGLPAGQPQPRVLVHRGGPVLQLAPRRSPPASGRTRSDRWCCSASPRGVPVRHRSVPRRPGPLTAGRRGPAGVVARDPAGELHARVQAEFGQDVRHVRLDRRHRWGDEQGRGDRRVGQLAQGGEMNTRTRWPGVGSTAAGSSRGEAVAPAWRASPGQALVLQGGAGGEQVAGDGRQGSLRVKGGG
jgi:hypothetical protein